MSDTCQSIDDIESLRDPLSVSLASAEDAVARVDERLRRSPLCDGLNNRLLYMEACATARLEGDLVHLDDLVLFDAGVFKGALSPALSRAFFTLQTWRRARQHPPATLLQLGRPGQWSDENPISLDPPTDRLSKWRACLRYTDRLPPTFAAATAADAWLRLDPEPGAAWRAPLLAALVLRARGKTPSLLLPVNTGRKATTHPFNASQGASERIAAILTWIAAAAGEAARDLDSLLLAERLYAPLLARQRRHSRLGKLVDLLLSSPVVSIPFAAHSLGVSPQAILKMLARLGPPARELTGRSRYRVWGIV
jgi:hypothetical protein